MRLGALPILALPLLLASCASTHAIQPQVAATSIDFARAETVRVTLSNFAFAPDHLTLHAGRPMVLELVNGAGGGHDFTAPEFFAAAQLAPADVALVTTGQVEMRGGQTVRLHLVPAAGEYRLVCTHLGHRVLGMAGTITVS